jgi:RHS repeat-associated protein
MLVSASGIVENESDYYPWGGERQITNTVSNHYKFTGKERDIETGLDYFGARYYSNGLGRFITPDWAAKATAVPYAEFSDPQSLNLYTYVRNIPTTRIDADGHCLEDACVLEGLSLGGALFIHVAGAIAIGIALNYAYDRFVANRTTPADIPKPTSQTLPASGVAKPTSQTLPANGVPAATTSATDARPGTLGKPDHQATVEEERARMNGEKEVTIQTPNGIKGSRRADTVGTNPETGATEIVQVYRPTPAGNIPKREVDAARDIENATEVKPTMVPVRPVPKPQPQPVPQQPTVQ